MIKVSPLRYGVIFKKAFTKPHIFTAFVKDFFGVDIEIDHVETEKSFSPPIGNVDSHFDLFAEDKKNRIIVDIQHRRYYDHYDRFLHYHCTALLEQVVSSSNYKTGLQVYTLVILTSGDKHKTDLSITDFEPKRLDGTGIGETQHKIIYACPKYVTDKTPAPYKEWLEAINDSLDEEVEENDYNNETIKEVFNLIKKNLTTPQEYTRMRNEYADDRYIKDEQQKAKEKGIKEGREEGMKENAQMMISEGLDLALITKITGLSIQQLKKLKE